MKTLTDLSKFWKRMKSFVLRQKRLKGLLSKKINTLIAKSFPINQKGIGRIHHRAGEFSTETVGNLLKMSQIFLRSVFRTTILLRKNENPMYFLDHRE